MIYCEHCGHQITGTCKLVRMHWDNMQGFRAAYLDEQCVNSYLNAMSSKYTLEHVTIVGGVYPPAAKRQVQIEDPFE